MNVDDQAKLYYMHNWFEQNRYAMEDEMTREDANDTLVEDVTFKYYDFMGQAVLLTHEYAWGDSLPAREDTVEMNGNTFEVVKAHHKYRLNGRTGKQELTSIVIHMKELH